MSALNTLVADLGAALNGAGPTVAANACANRRRAARRRRRRNTTRPFVNNNTGLPEGQATAVVGGPTVSAVGMTRMRNTSAAQRIGAAGAIAASVGAPMPDYTVGWLERHLDPCGEYRTALDYGKIPDGTLPQSVSGQFREVFTIRYPGADSMSAPLDGRMWSLVIVHTPYWRTPFVLVADMERSEVSDSAFSAALRTLNNVLDVNAVRYPEWFPTTLDGVFVSIVQWTALRTVPPPSDVGVSPLIQDFRITGDGYTMTHNTPSLINQGIVVTAQFNSNNELRTVASSLDDGSSTADWAFNVSPQIAGSVAVIGVLPGIGAYPWDVTTTVALPLPGATTNSSAFPVTEGPYTISVGGVPTTAWSVGDNIRFQITASSSPAPYSYTVAVQVQTGGTGAFSNVPGMSSTSAPGSTVSGANGAGIIAAVESHSQRVNITTVPPVTQEDLQQQTAKTIQYLLKEEEGYYVVKRAWQPVFLMTPASSYAPLRFADLDSDITSLSDSVGRLYDTVDSNYGFSVANLTSLPLACAPYIKAIRSWEAVPARRSAWGPFTTTTTPKDDNAVVIAKTITDIDPFAYPVDYNGLGLLFSKVVKVITRIPKILRTATNVADTVANVATQVQSGVNTISQQTTGRRRRGLRTVVQ